MVILLVERIFASSDARNACGIFSSSTALANRYWRALAGDRAKNEADYRSGRDVIEAYREPALLSKEGVEAFASAYQELFRVNGEIPRMAVFDEPLVLSLKAKLPEMGGTDRRNVEWILHSIGGQMRKVNEFYKKGCQEKTSSLTGDEGIYIS